MDSSDEEPQIEDDDVLCKYGTALTPYEAGKCREKAKFLSIAYVLTIFR